MSLVEPPNKTNTLISKKCVFERKSKMNFKDVYMYLYIFILADKKCERVHTFRGDVWKCRNIN